MSSITAEKLQALIESHGAALVLYARQWCNCPDDALQEALMDLARQDPSPRDSVAWLFRAVRCKALNLARSQRRRDHYHRQAALEREAWFERDPTQSIQSNELEALLETLDPLPREIVVARIWGGMSFEQIAELVESSISSVYRCYQQTLRHLESKLSGIAENR